ncbi:AbiJ-NTD4 domain-containing protein [Paraburkholderia aspalathi]|uniref:AbiJ-NTD4 domain-containing protein n=1 Tax=Paraburkholderia aspalathi TaxID=1324617 RepID=UPI0038BB138A
MRFSERNGLVKTPEALRPEAMPDDLRNTLWNAITTVVDSRLDPDSLTESYWRDFIKKPVDSRPLMSEMAWETFKKHFLSAEYAGVYDRIEFLLDHIDDAFVSILGKRAGKLANAVNWALERELAAYRVVNGLVVPVTSQQEIDALDEALSLIGPFAGAQTHIASALTHLSNRQNPDLRNSIKESISAVEAAASVVAGKPGATLGAALATLEKERKLHGSLKAAFSSLYGYTSDANGIRHALMDESDLTAADAKFFLLTCSSFVNYLKSLT